VLHQAVVPFRLNEDWALITRTKCVLRRGGEACLSRMQRLCAEVFAVEVQNIEQKKTSAAALPAALDHLALGSAR
jgi:hypothetical protein